jgi:alpha-glutamyl/putrescinyl thymine pyrophosphorylase-like protein
MPTFCRHNRFIERCPICSKTLPGYASEATGSRRAAAGPSPASDKRSGRRGARPEAVRVRREGRAEQDGYGSELLPGIRASADAARLASEIAFSSARLQALAQDPPDFYAHARGLAAEDRERATWMCFLSAYLSPLEGEDPFAGIRMALARGSGRDWEENAEPPDLSDIPLGPRTSHDPARGADTLLAYRQWVERAGRAAAGEPAQSIAFSGDQSWSPERRFERVFERLALPGLGRTGRYELLLTLGRLEIYELRPDSLHLAGAAGLSAGDPTALAAKRVFGIGDSLLLERRAGALADAISVPIETLDLALANWGAPQRATVGFPPDASDDEALARATDALGL